MSALRIFSYGASSLGLLLIAIPVIPGAFASIQTAITTQQLEIEQKLAQDNIKRQEELKRFGYEEKQKTLDKASKIGEHIE